MSIWSGLLAATPIGQRMAAARQQQEMSYYRNLMAQRQQQEWDAQQAQLKAGKDAYASRGWTPAMNIPVTPQVGSPNYAQSRMALDQFDPQGKVQVGNIGEFTPQQAGLLEAMANTGQFNLAGQAAKDFMPQAPEWQGARMGGLLGQQNLKTGKFDPFPQQTAPTPQRQMTADELKQWGFPEGTVASVNTITGEPEVKYRPDIRERSDLEQRATQATPFLNERTGQMVFGEYESNLGPFYRDKAGNKVRIDPNEWRPTTPSTGGFLNQNQFIQRQDELVQEQQALQRLNEYGKSVGGMNVGIKNWADSVTAKFRTMLGSKELNPQQFARMTAEGQLQALLGLFRTDVVGPGVMTEYDAQRVMQALGGNVGMLQNPQVVQKLLSDIYANKMERVRVLQQQINRNAPVFDTNPMQITAPENFTGTGAPPAPDGRGGGPAVGTVEDGYRFKGGNPADPNSWEKVE